MSFEQYVDSYGDYDQPSYYYFDAKPGRRKRKGRKPGKPGKRGKKPGRGPSGAGAGGMNRKANRPDRSPYGTVGMPNRGRYFARKARVGARRSSRPMRGVRGAAPRPGRPVRGRPARRPVRGRAFSGFDYFAAAKPNPGAAIAAVVQKYETQQQVVGRRRRVKEIVARINEHLLGGFPNEAALAGFEGELGNYEKFKGNKIQDLLGQGYTLVDRAYALLDEQLAEEEAMLEEEAMMAEEEAMMAEDQAMADEEMQAMQDEMAAQREELIRAEYEGQQGEFYPEDGYYPEDDGYYPEDGGGYVPDYPISAVPDYPVPMDYPAVESVMVDLDMDEPSDVVEEELFGEFDAVAAPRASRRRRRRILRRRQFQPLAGRALLNTRTATCLRSWCANRAARFCPSNPPQVAGQLSRGGMVPTARFRKMGYQTIKGRKPRPQRMARRGRRAQRRAMRRGRAFAGFDAFDACGANCACGGTCGSC